MRPGIAHGTGTTGFQERSRVATLNNSNNSSRIPSVVYLKSQAPGSGTLERADEADPKTQSEKYVSRIAGPAEVEWAHRRMDEHGRVREMRLKISHFRFEILKKAILESSPENRKIILENCRKCEMILDQLPLNARTDNDLKNYLILNASPEEIASVLPRSVVVNEVEPQVAKLAEALFQEYSAGVQQ
jgi:hypothetical protein